VTRWPSAAGCMVLPPGAALVEDIRGLGWDQARRQRGRRVRPTSLRRQARQLRDVAGMLDPPVARRQHAERRGPRRLPWRSWSARRPVADGAAGGDAPRPGAWRQRLRPRSAGSAPRARRRAAAARQYACASRRDPPSTRAMP
jgi:hypothetical protein